MAVWRGLGGGRAYHDNVLSQSHCPKSECSRWLQRVGYKKIGERHSSLPSSSWEAHSATQRGSMQYYPETRWDQYYPERTRDESLVLSGNGRPFFRDLRPRTVRTRDHIFIVSLDGSYVVSYVRLRGGARHIVRVFHPSGCSCIQTYSYMKLHCATGHTRRMLRCCCWCCRKFLGGSPSRMGGGSFK